MCKRSGRKKDRKGLESIRVRAVEQVLAGGNPNSVIRSLGFSRGCVYEWLKKFRQGGWEALKSKHISGRPHRLSKAQQALVYQRLLAHTSLELGLDSALWTRSLLAEFIADQFQVHLSRASVGRLLHEFGLASEHPCQRMSALNPIAMLAWQRKDLKQIRLLARPVRAEIAFLSVTRVSGWIQAKPASAEAQNSPSVASSAKKLISVFSPNGQIRFMVVQSPLTAESHAAFLRRLMHGRTRPIFLIVPENFPQSDATLQACVSSFAGRLRLFRLPLFVSKTAPLSASSAAKPLPVGPMPTAHAELWREIPPARTPFQDQSVPLAISTIQRPSPVRPGGVSP